MSERATPETDSAIWTIDSYVRVGGDDVFEVVSSEISRKLERERDDARELARELRDALQSTLTSLIGRMVIKGTDTVERAHYALAKAKEVLR